MPKMVIADDHHGITEQQWDAYALLTVGCADYVAARVTRAHHRQASSLHGLSSNETRIPADDEVRRVSLDCCGGMHRQTFSSCGGSSTAATAAIEPMTVKSPLIYSYALSKLDEAPAVYLKLETVQPSGSFKDRGMANLCRHLKRSGAKRLVSSSGGNAGHSAAMCGRVLGLPVKVVVPTTTKPLMLEKIKAQGAEVEVYGDNWNAADAVARRLVEEDPQSAYISPYDHPLLWEGHSSIIDEIKEAGVKPGAVIASVGGGGLLCGVYEGLARVGWNDVTVVAAETEGAASFYEAFKAGRPVRLERIATVATSLGALEVTPRAIEYSRRQPTSAQIVTDAEAVTACRRLLDDYRILVEPACGAALALVYTDRHRAELAKAARGAPVVVIVCGGSAITPEILDSMERTGERSP